eukprot:scaffold100775_cov72-Cyclotella_meneghiniana.AAC.6
MPVSSEPNPNNNFNFDGPINKKRACASCHKSKQRCEWSTADQKKCDRCIRLNKDCTIFISRQGQRPKKTPEDAPKGHSTGKKNSPQGGKKYPYESGDGDGDLKLPAVDGNGNKPAAAWNMFTPFTRHVAYSDISPQTSHTAKDPGQNIQPNPLAASMPNPANLLADQRRMILLQRQLGSQYPQSSLPFAGHHDPSTISRENILAVLKSSMAFPQGNPLAMQVQNHAISNFLQMQPQTLTTQVLVEQLRQLEKKKLELDALKQCHNGLQQGIIPGAQLDVHQGGSSNVSAGLDKSDEAQAQSRLKKNKKVHLLDLVRVNSESDVVNKKRSVDINEVSFGEAQIKKAKQDESANQSMQEILKPHPAKLSLQNQVLDSDIDFISILTKVLQNNHSRDSLKCHFGLQALIRQLIALSIARRNFDLLSQASNLALKFGLTMNRILCGVIDDNPIVSSGDVVGSPMNYLLSMLLEPHPAQAHHSVGNVFVPNLPRSLLACIAPLSCSSFGELDVGNRWVLIREASAGIANVYCSPMFEKSVVSSSQLSHHDDGIFGIFSTLLPKEMYKRLVSIVAEQISSNARGTDVQVFPVYEPSKICLRNCENSSQTETNVSEKTMPGKVPQDDVLAVDVDIMFSSIQTMDKHWYYLEFFFPSSKSKDGGTHSMNQIITPYLSPKISLPPSYADVKKMLVSFLNLNGTRAGSYISRRASIPERASKSGRTFVYPGELIIYFIVHFSRWFRLLVVAWRWLGSPVLSKGRVSTGALEGLLFLHVAQIWTLARIWKCAQRTVHGGRGTPGYGSSPGYGGPPGYKFWEKSEPEMNYIEQKKCLQFVREC